MHELVVNDWLDHDYIARHTEGWPACANARCLDARAHRRSLRHRRRRGARQLARDYGGTTKPAAIRLNYGMQRVHGGGRRRGRRGCPA